MLVPFFSLFIRLRLRSTLFPYTTLFRSASMTSLPTPSPGIHAILYLAIGKRLYRGDRKSTRLNSSHLGISYAVFCLKKKKSVLIDYPTLLNGGLGICYL